MQNIFLSAIAVTLIVWSGLITLLSRNNWNEMWSGAHSIESFFSFNYFFSNISNIQNYNFQIHNIYFFILIGAFIFGTYQILRRKQMQKLIIFLLVISLFLFGYYSAFFAGGYSIGNTVHSRFAAIWLSFFVIIAGIGFESILQSINKRHALGLGLSIFAILSIYLQLNLQDFFPRTNQLWAVKQTEASLALAKANPDCLYLATHTDALKFQGFETLTLDEVNQMKNAFNNSQQCVLFLELDTCKHEHKVMCDTVLANYPWRKLNFEPVNLWQYSAAGQQYEPIVPQFIAKEPQSVFSILKSKFNL